MPVSLDPARQTYPTLGRIGSISIGKVSILLFRRQPALIGAILFITSLPFGGCDSKIICLRLIPMSFDEWLKVSPASTLGFPGATLHVHPLCAASKEVLRL